MYSQYETTNDDDSKLISLLSKHKYCTVYMNESLTQRELLPNYRYPLIYVKSPRSC